jgi:hypothetical protein
MFTKNGHNNRKSGGNKPGNCGWWCPHLVAAMPPHPPGSNQNTTKEQSASVVNSGKNSAFRHYPAMRFKCFFIPAVAAIALVCAHPGRAQQITVTPDRTNGVYRVGDAVQWRVDWTGGETNMPSAHYKFLKGGLTDAGHGDLNFSNGIARLETRFDAPGTMLAEVKWNSESNRALAGAVAAPEQISLAAPCPPDFDAFWKSKLKELGESSSSPGIGSGEHREHEPVVLENHDGQHPGNAHPRPACLAGAGQKISGIAPLPMGGRLWPAKELGCRSRRRRLAGAGHRTPRPAD